MSSVNIESVDFTADAELISFVNGKVEKLNLFYDKIVNTDVFLKVDKKESHDNKVVEIKLNVPGRELFAKKQAASFEGATDEAVDALRRQVKKYKEKLSA